MFQYEGQTVPSIRTALPGPRASELLNRDSLYVSGSYTRIYPLVVDRGSGAVIVDVDGNMFLDFTAGIAVANTGHCHPAVVAAIQEQAARLIHMSGTDFYYRPQIELAEKLAKLAPGFSPKKVFFCNSGAEAIEAAMKLSRWHTKRSRIVAFYGGFHGRTFGAMSLSASKLTHRRGFSPLLPDIHHLPFPRECPEVGGCTKSCHMVDEMEKTILKRTAPPEEVAAIVVEPIQGEGGYHALPAGCMLALRQLCDRHGIMLVVDEVQSGFGRTGKMFAMEHYSVEPDIICLAKGIASGLPLGAIVAKSDVMDWPTGSHASTFGGNPIACHAALTTLELLQDGYISNSRDRGDQLRSGLKTIAWKHGVISSVRGLGLMTAADAPDSKTRDLLIEACFRKGLLLLGCGESALRFCPPLCVSEEQVAICLVILEEVIQEFQASPVE